jgi:hypothetical protein
MKTKKATGDKRFCVIDPDNWHETMLIKANNPEETVKKAIDEWEIDVNGPNPFTFFVYEMVNPHTITITRTATITKGVKNDIED